MAVYYPLLQGSLTDNRRRPRAAGGKSGLRRAGCWL